MRDHFVLLVDRLLTESTLEAAIESMNRSNQAMPGSAGNSDCRFEYLQISDPLPSLGSASKHDIIDLSSHDVASSPIKSVQCRICHDDDEDLNMEIPCSCRGSLKYVHRKCVQRWCNEKGNIICEICRQQFKPGYTAPPPPLLHHGGVPVNFRDLPTPRFITYDRDFLESDIDDYSTTSSRSVTCCRAIAIIFTVLLVLRHTLPIVISGTGDHSLTLFTLLMLRAIGIMLPVYIMVKAFTAIQRRHRRHHQDPRFSLDESDEENDLPQSQQQQQQPQPRLIRVH